MHRPVRIWMKTLDLRSELLNNRLVFVIKALILLYVLQLYNVRVYTMSRIPVF